MEFIRNNLKIIIIVGVIIIVFSISLKLNIQEERDQKRILGKGRSARAKVISLEDTTAKLNYDPVIIIFLEINDGNSKYRTSTRMVLNQLLIPQVQPGKIVPIKIDPEDSSKVMLDLDAMN